MQSIVYTTPLMPRQHMNWRSRIIGAILRFAKHYSATSLRFSFSNDESLYVTADFSGDVLVAFNDGAKEALELRIRELHKEIALHTVGPMTIASGNLFLTCSQDGIAAKTMPERQDSTVIGFPMAALPGDKAGEELEDRWYALMRLVVNLSDLPFEVATAERKADGPELHTVPVKSGLLRIDTKYLSQRTDLVVRNYGIADPSYEIERGLGHRLYSFLDITSTDPHTRVAALSEVPMIEFALKSDPAQLAAIGPNRVWIINNRHYTKWQEHAERLVGTGPSKNLHLRVSGLDRLSPTEPELTAIKAEAYPDNFLIKVFDSLSTKKLQSRLLVESKAALATLWSEYCTTAIEHAVELDLNKRLVVDNKLKLPLRYNQAPIFFGFNVSNVACTHHVGYYKGHIAFLVNPKKLGESTSSFHLASLASLCVASLGSPTRTARERIAMRVLEKFYED